MRTHLRLFVANAAVVLALGMLSACDTPTLPSPLRFNASNITYVRIEVNNPALAWWTPSFFLTNGPGNTDLSTVVETMDVVKTGDNEWQSPLGFLSLAAEMWYDISVFDPARSIVGGPGGTSTVGTRIAINGVVLTRLANGNDGAIRARFRFRKDGTID